MAICPYSLKTIFFFCARVATLAKCPYSPKDFFFCARVATHGYMPNYILFALVTQRFPADEILLSYNKRMNVMRVNCVNFSFLLVSLVWRPNDCHYTSYSHYIQYFHIFPTFEHARWGGRSTLTLSSLSLFFAVPTFPRSLIFFEMTHQF